MDRRLGRPLPCQLANPTRVHLIPPEFFTLYHAVPCAYAVLAAISNCYPPVWGRLPTRYSPVRHSVTKSSFRRNQIKCFVRLACVKHAASVHPEPGSNSHVKSFNPARISGFSKSETSSYRNLDSGFTVFKVCFIKSCSFIFRWLELFSYESFKVIHCSVINVLCCFQQLWYIIIIICTCQQLFYFVLLRFRSSSLSLVCDSLLIIPNRHSFVNNFFHHFISWM